MSRVLVVGSINVDRTILVANIPQSGETVLGELVHESCGGKGANQAFAAARLGAAVSMIAVIGHDSDGEKSVKNLMSVGVDVSAISKSERVSGNATITLDSSGNNMIIVVSGANLDCLPPQVDMKLLQESRIILLQLEIPIETIDYVLRHKPADALLILDPAPVHPAVKALTLQHVDILTPNEAELMTLTGRSRLGTIAEVSAAAQTLLESGVGNVLVTMGAKGALLVNKEGHRHFPAPRVEVVDTTAAGDTFNGALAAALSRDQSLEEAIVFASKASSISVTRKGAQDSIPSLKEIMQLS